MGDETWSFGPGKIRRRPPVPIVSYGIILFTDSVGMTEPSFLLYRRRDTFEYIDFLRGGWYSDEQLPYLFSMMTPEERDRLRRCSLRELWDDLWVQHTCKIYHDGYVRAKRKYDSVSHKIADILNTTHSTIEYPPMGWPKGKKNNIRESPRACAMREFTEETRIPISEDMIWSDRSYVEKFRGGNGKLYQTYYFVAYTPVPILVEKIKTPQCIRNDTISEEASDLYWMTAPEACRNLNYRRQCILADVLNDIQLIKPPRRPPGL